ncbi:AAA-like domain-containing protein [Leptolyngbya sp. FACHB-541]|uniref:AAA-like domain-containing protein n=1 Tax=Leptolyngbya sp. FACHB-541 TaxID=2692810 RepID=UPI0016860C63|nr:AAA-like domain-containing protein [Leptolyngbya sp. FACHB-541]MBD2001008.1 AAA-like domain-containing protein [Leptolyngbya sp. FACHB-541]
MPSTAKPIRLFISYRSQDPDMSLAQRFYEALDAAGYESFMAGESIRLGENWAQRVDEELERADYFLLLLSPKSATSEMVIEEVRRAKELRDRHPQHKPAILPIRVNFPWDSPLNYDLRGYLNRVQQREWKTEADTPKILQEILTLLAAGSSPSPAFAEPEEPDSQPLTPCPLPPPNSPPLPIAEPELPGGQVDLASVFYVEREPIEADCYEAIARSGALIRIKAPRQMGKTSLLSRILQQAKELDYLTVPLSFQLADTAVFADLDKFLRWFCASIGRRLRLPNRLNDYWDEIFGSKDNCTAYFEEYLLTEINSPLALGLDEVDCVFQHPEIAADFFGLLRAWHEDSKSRDLWKKLRLVVVHSTEVYIPLNINQSPFNVGLPIELPEFTPAQVLDLAKRHGLNWSLDQVEQLMNMVGGHPYLVRVALYQITRGETSLTELLQSAPTGAGLYGDHLRRHLWNLEQHPELAKAVKVAIASPDPVRLESVQAFQLHSMGLVHLKGNDVQPRCDLYRRYFSDRLRRK